MHNLQLAILATILFSIALAIMSTLLPLAPSWTGGWVLYHLRIIVAIFIPALHVIAALFFFLGLQGFKEDLRRAYVFIATAVILMGIILLASPAITIFDLWDTWIMTYGTPNFLYSLPLIILFIGLGIFFRTLNIKSVWRSPWFTMAFVAVCVGLVLLVPHVPSHLPEWLYDFGNAMFMFTSASLFAIGISILVVCRHLSANYAIVLKWLAAGFILQAVLVGTSVLTKAIGLEPRSLANLQDVLLLAAVPHLVAGILFFRLTEDTRTIERQRNASAVDVVLYVASLVSNAQAVDPILDNLREVTSRLQEGEPLSVADQARLGDVYLALEDYLAKKEPLRTFTQTQLRTLVHQKFAKDSLLSAGEAFWAKLPLQQSQSAKQPSNQPTSVPV